MTTIVIMALCLSATARAGGNDLDLTLAQPDANADRRMTKEEYEEFVRGLSIVVAEPSLARYSPLGPYSIDVAASLGVADIPQYVSYWGKATKDGHAPEVYWQPRTHLRFGFPVDVDVGAFYGQLPGTGVQTFGGDLRYSVIPGSYLSPSLGLRAGFQRVVGIGGLQLDLVLAEIGICKDYPNMSLMAGLLEIFAMSTPDNLPRKPDKPGQTVKSQRIFTGFIAKGMLGVSNRISGNFWVHSELGLGRVYSAAVTLKYFVENR